MSLLGPISGALFYYIAGGAAALAVTAYIIKMRRRRFEVPFSALWKRVLEQKDVNSLWKQLKRLISLLLMLLIIGVVLFSALDPTLGAVDRKARSVVILIDASASMKSTDGDDEGKKTRMQVAREEADKLIDSMGGGDIAMIMRVDNQTTPLSRFTSDQPMLHKIVHGVTDTRDPAEIPGLPKSAQPATSAEENARRAQQMLQSGVNASDTPADLTRALSAAADALRDRPNPLIVLISDGAFPEQALELVTFDKPKPVESGSGSGSGSAKPQPKIGQGSNVPGGLSPTLQFNMKNLATVDLSGVDVRYIPVGKKSENVGIIAFNVRRYIANKAAYEVYIEVQNFGQEAAHRELKLYNGTTNVNTLRIDLAPGQRLKQIYTNLPGSTENKLSAVLAPVDGPGGSDTFALDDTAYALLPVRKKQKVLMVTTDNLFLEGALLVYDNVDPAKVSPEEYKAKPSLADGMDVVIFDDFTPEVLPPPPASLLFFHPSGENSPVAMAKNDINKPHITEIDQGHPVMRWVTMADVFMDRSSAFVPEARRGESCLSYAVRDCLVAAKRDGKRKVLAFGFSLPASGRDSATDLPLRVAFPMLLVNALDWFAGDQSDLLTTYPTGTRERIPLDGAVGATEAEVKGPDGGITRTPVVEGLATFYGHRVGFYEVAAKDALGKVIARIELAANLASPSESDIAPSAELTLGGKNGKKLEAPEKFAITHSRQLWIYLILFAMGLILVEWITYHRRITV
ncbi:MAG: VWA domain-containing protein [Deltaproteobacteria bacterium]|nr:VWA domain-containing protein [Deltaproteobacteria bacterium]